MEIYLFICCILGAIAHHQSKNWIMVLALSVFLSPLAGILALILIKPDSKKVERMAVKSKDKRKCPYCAEIIKAEASVCRYCHKDIEPAASVEEEIIIVPGKVQKIGKYTRYH